MLYRRLSHTIRSISSRMTPNEIRTWSHSLRELLYDGKPEEVLQQYYNRQLQVSDLSVQTYCILFKAYILTKKWSEGHQLHTQIRMNTKLYNDQRLKLASRLYD